MDIRNKLWQYQGTTSVIVIGNTCQLWQPLTPYTHIIGSTNEEFPDGSIAAAANFCHNLNRETYLLYYTTDPNPRTETCNENF